jgi:hypothetical protein
MRERIYKLSAADLELRRLDEDERTGCRRGPAPPPRNQPLQPNKAELYCR